MQYQTTTEWHNQAADFTVKTYDRTHQIQFGGGSTIAASAAPEFVGNAKLPNPEELFTAAIASCFMLTFLYLAASKGINIASYKATNIGKLGKNSEGKMAMTEVSITPSITYLGEQQPESQVIQDLFAKAHAMCFISCSVKTMIRINS